MTEYDGRNGKLVLDLENGTLTLIREGFVARNTAGEGRRVIDLSTLSGVRLDRDPPVALGWWAC